MAKPTVYPVFSLALLPARTVGKSIHVWFLSTAREAPGRLCGLCQSPKPSVQKVRQERLRVHAHGRGWVEIFASHFMSFFLNKTPHNRKKWPVIYLGKEMEDLLLCKKLFAYYFMNQRSMHENCCYRGSTASQIAPYSLCIALLLTRVCSMWGIGCHLGCCPCLNDVDTSV